MGLGAPGGGARVRRVTTWLALAAIAWLAWAALVFVAQRRLIFPRHLLNPAVSGAAAPAGAERIDLATASGPGLAWYVPPEGAEAPAPALVFAHGNAELARDWVAAFRSFGRRGVAVLLVEYPGYGEAPGAPSRSAIADVVAAGWDHLAERPEVDGRRIVGLGRSLGGGAITELATRRSLAGLVLQSTFTRIRDFAPRLLVPPFLVRDPFDNVAAVSSFDGPVLVFHGTEDRVIPYAHGRALAAASPRGELVTWSCGHNDCPPDWDAWVGRVAAFVHGLEPAAPRRDSGKGGG